MLYGLEDIKKVLPHRAPFLFLTQINAIEFNGGDLTEEMKSLVGSTVHAEFHVDKDLEILKGHFPGQPIYPGVIQVEMMAQASAFIALLLPQYDINNLKLDTRLLGVDKARFRKLITPGMTLRIETTLKRIRGQFNTYATKAFDESNELVSECEVLAMIEFL